MSRETSVIVALLAACFIAIYLRRRFWRPETPLRAWYETKMKVRLKSVAPAFFIVTLLAWIVIWAMAPRSGEYKFLENVRSLFPPASLFIGGLVDKIKEPVNPEIPSAPAGN